VRTVAVTNQKGGSGKTTTSVNLAAAQTERKRRVLVMDMDPQASASAWLGVQDGGRGLLDVFVDNGNLEEVIQNTDIPGIDVIPSSTWLVSAEKTLAGEVGSELVLHRALAALPKDRWSHLLIDCPPSLGLLTVSALAAVQEVLVPVEAHVMALAGLVQLLKTVEVVKDRLNADLKVSGILACRVDYRTRHAQEVVERLRTRFGKLVFKTVIRENVRLAEAPSFSQPITAYDNLSRGAEDYRAVAGEFIGKERRSVS